MFRYWFSFNFLEFTSAKQSASFVFTEKLQRNITSGVRQRLCLHIMYFFSLNLRIDRGTYLLDESVGTSNHNYKKNLNAFLFCFWFSKIYGIISQFTSIFVSNASWAAKGDLDVQSNLDILATQTSWRTIPASKSK